MQLYTLKDIANDRGIHYKTLHTQVAVGRYPENMPTEFQTSNGIKFYTALYKSDEFEPPELVSLSELAQLTGLQMPVIRKHVNTGAIEVIEFTHSKLVVLEDVLWLCEEAGSTDTPVKPTQDLATDSNSTRIDNTDTVIALLAMLEKDVSNEAHRLVLQNAIQLLRD